MIWNKRKKSRGEYSSKKGGFFIAELIVAIFIFGIVMTVSVGALITGLDVNKKTQALKTVLNNLNIVLDSMSKNLAVGRYYRCEGFVGVPDKDNPRTLDCPNGDDEITFLFNEDYDGNGEIDDVVNYRFVMDAELGYGYITRRMYNSDSSGPGDTVEVRMTAPDVRITKATFFVSDSNTQRITGDVEQARVLILVSGYVETGGRVGRTEFNVQTMVSQLVPDS